jgi:[acyl-carrier-protein] S-malonyltransferase
MQADLPGRHPVVAATYTEASEVLGFDLWDLVQNGPKERLDETTITQPAMLTAGVAAWRAWLSANGASPAMVAGHSLGEYSALVAAETLSFTDAVALVRRRAELMQNAVPAGTGAMAAILGLDDERIVEICAAASGDGVAEAVNFNSPGQVVVAGDRAAIERMTELAKAAGARRALLLAVSVPAHSSLMRPAGVELAEAIDATNFNNPAMPVVCAVDGTLYGDAEDVKARMKLQVFSPVRWVDTIKFMTDHGITTVVECGPGKVLAGLVKRIDRELDIFCIDSADGLQHCLDGAGK